MKKRRGFLLALLVIAGLIVYALVNLGTLRRKMDAAAETQAELQRQLQQLESENAALQYAVDNAEDPEVIAGVARDKLGLVMPEEQIFLDGNN